MDDPSASAYGPRTVMHIDEEVAALSELFNVFNVNDETGPPGHFVYCPLPTETLETIFILCARNYSESIGKPIPTLPYRVNVSFGKPIPTPPYWVNVSYVCRQWRDVALNCASLWTYLFNTSPRWTEELLVRSKQASLKLNVNLFHGSKNRRSARFFEQVVRHLERIQDLHLYICRRDYDVFLPLLSARAPRLEHLEILMGGFHAESPSPWLLFDGETPALRRLELLDCSVSWYSLKLTALTTLNLRHIPVQCQQSIEDFLATLRCMPNLQRLHLHDSLAHAIGFLSSAVLYSFQKIELPHLSRVLINAPVSTIVALLSCVNIPLETQVSLGPNRFSEGISSPMDAYTPLYLLLAQRYGASKDQAASRPTIRSLGIQCYDGVVTFNFGTLEHDHSLCVPSGWRYKLPPQILLSLRINGHEDLVSHTCRSIPVANVESLDVFDPPFDLTFWTDVLGHCRGLRYMKLRNGDMPNMTSLLSATPRDCTENQDEHANRAPSHMFVPALEELELHDIEFPMGMRRDVLRRAVLSPPPAEVVTIRSIFDALSTRKEPRGRLIMMRCVENISSYQVREFDMEGTWGDGCFRTVSCKQSFRSG